MRKSFARVPITPQTLCKTEPSWEAVHDGPNDEVLFHAVRDVAFVSPAAAVACIKAREELEVHEGGDEGVELIGEPEIGELHGEKGRGDHSTLGENC